MICGSALMLVPYIQRTNNLALSAMLRTALVSNLSTSGNAGDTIMSLPLSATMTLNKGGESLHCSKPIKAAIDRIAICAIALYTFRSQ
jgi:hypothetical protein